MPVARRGSTQQTAPDMGDQPWEFRWLGIEDGPFVGAFREGMADGLNELGGPWPCFRLP